MLIFVVPCAKDKVLCLRKCYEKQKIALSASQATESIVDLTIQLIKLCTVRQTVHYLAVSCVLLCKFTHLQ